MSRLKWVLCAVKSLAMFVSLCGTVAAIELTINGDFETGDFTGWTQFETGEGQQVVTRVNPSAGTYAGEIFNNTDTSNSLIKQANLAAGALTPGQTVDISFDARGSYGIGGVAFAELFSELDGGGVSKSEILGGAPLGISGDSSIWTTFHFTTTLGSDVGGGVTLQLGATNGAVANETSTLWYDNVSVSVDSLVGLDLGDFDNDGDVDGADFLLWQRGESLNGPVQLDLIAWKDNYGSASAFTAAVMGLPEPGSLALAGMGLFGLAIRRR